MGHENPARPYMGRGLRPSQSTSSFFWYKNLRDRWRQHRDDDQAWWGVTKEATKIGEEADKKDGEGDGGSAAGDEGAAAAQGVGGAIAQVANEGLDDEPQEGAHKATPGLQTCGGSPAPRHKGPTMRVGEPTQTRRRTPWTPPKGAAIVKP